MKKKSLIVLISLLMLIVFDQIIKYLIVKNFSIGEEKILIDNFLKFIYIRNTGAAFGILSGNIVFLIGISLLLIFYIVKEMKKNIDNNLSLLSFSLILGGAVGNLIDRIFRGRVIDFIDISPVFNFPTFNIADILVVIGWIAFALNMAIYTTRKLKNLKKELKKKKKCNSK